MGLCFRGVLTGAALKVGGARTGGGKKERKSLLCVSTVWCECVFPRARGGSARPPFVCACARAGERACLAQMERLLRDYGVTGRGARW